MKPFKPIDSVLFTAIARSEHEISLMGDYRTRLTADIVTGSWTCAKPPVTLLRGSMKGRTTVFEDEPASDQN